MRDHRAAIPVAQVLAVHPAVLLHPLHPVALHLRVLHLQSHLVRIVIVVAKIYRRVVVHQIALAQLDKFRKGVKPVIHAGFAPNR
jgi:ABC-type anion transport system duplicated permease subunit